MKLNTLKLPSSVISTLYNKTLVTTGEPQSPTTKSNDKTEIPESDIPITQDEIKFLGGNGKNILIAVNNKNINFLPDDELGFLTNMLTACKFGLADVAIINLNTIGNPSYKTIFEKFKPEIVLLYGTDPAMLNLPVSFPHFQVQSFNNYTFLFTPALHEIQEDKILKSKLWVCLRRIFNV